MRDFDFHPAEDTVRCFGVPESGVVANDDQVWVSQTRQPEPFGTMADDLVLRHFAFADEWFKINATFDLAGNLIQPGPPETPFAVNCDMATPMARIGDDVSSVDLFLDVLVRVDGRYWIADRDEFDQALDDGLITSGEARGAEAGLERLISWIDSGRLTSLIHDYAFETINHAPRPLPLERCTVHDVPSVAPVTRPTWHLHG